LDHRLPPGRMARTHRRAARRNGSAHARPRGLTLGGQGAPFLPPPSSTAAHTGYGSPKRGALIAGTGRSPAPPVGMSLASPSSARPTHRLVLGRYTAMANSVWQTLSVGMRGSTRISRLPQPL